MLVLSRRVGESVVIGEDVVITVLEVRGDVIRVGIEAPRQIQVHREEVYREVQRANREAAASSDADVEALGRALRAHQPADGVSVPGGASAGAAPSAGAVPAAGALPSAGAVSAAGPPHHANGRPQGGAAARRERDRRRRDSA